MAEGRRRRPTRLLWVALFVLLLWLLLRLNQFLPGVWPGGGEDKGLRPTPAGSEADPTTVRPSETPPVAPTHRPATIHVVVRMPDGTPKVDGDVFFVTSRSSGADTRWSRGILSLGKEAAGGAEFEVKEGQVLRAFGALLETPDFLPHGSPPVGAARQWVVQLPRASVPRVEVASPSTVVRVVGADGMAIPGATVDVKEEGRDSRVVVGTDGRAVIDADLVYRACASAPGYGESCAYGKARSPDPLVLTLSKNARISTRFIDPATGAPLSARSLRLVSPDGTVKTLERASGAFSDFETTLPSDVAAATRIEIDVAGRPIVRDFLSSLAATTAVPEGRLVTIVVRDPAGNAVPKAAVRALFLDRPSRENGIPILQELTESLETDAEGRVAVAIPIDREAELSVDAAGLAPAGLHLTSNGVSPTTVSLSRGISVSIRVVDSDGKPVAGADVMLLVKAGDLPARRTGRTGPDGVARVEGVPAGRAEAYAHRAGLAWGFASVDATEGMSTVALTLRPGRRLHLVVEDPRGVPLRDVAVRAVPRADAAGAPDPMDPDGRPWATDEHGVLTVSDLSDREVDLYLSKPGFADEIVPRVVPGPTTWFATLVATR